MSRGQRLRALVSERLTAAAEEIFALVEKTILEYEEELSRSKEENQRKQQLLDQVLIPEEVPAPSIDVQIQTERHSDAALCKQEEDMVCSLLKKEASGLRRPMETEVYILDPDPDPLLPENPETVVTETAKECPVGKRKRGRPRRVPVPADAVEKRQQRSGEGRVEKKRVGRGAAPVHPAPASPPPEPLMEDVLLPKDSHKPLYKSKYPEESEECFPESFDSPMSVVARAAGAAGEFCCTSCDRVFNRLHHLERHVLTHTGVRSFCCSVCDRTFRLKQHLISHMTIHRDERLFICPLCPRRFKRKDNLGRHIMVHSGLRPYGCPQCDVQFSLKKNLLRHMIVHERDMTLHCNVCNKRFSSPYYFQRHLKTHERM